MNDNCCENIRALALDDVSGLKGQMVPLTQQNQQSTPSDEICSDTEISDEYGSASDSSSSIEKMLHSLDRFTNKHYYLSNSNSSSKNSAKQVMDRCKQVWRMADAVCFDVDSTVCCDEAIDELASYVGKTKEVSDLTKAAMLGGADFREALAERLKIIQPSSQVIAQYLATHPPRLTDHIEELIKELHNRGVDVYLISGGFDVIIQPAAAKLNIPVENIYANSIKFFYDGSYAGFEKSRPTSNQDGKSRVIAMLKNTRGYKNVVMIGDGVTDLEACPPADAFIGFGGNQVRETVKAKSDWFIYNFKELITELPYCDRNLRSQ